jgi:RNA ligase (TIGR02306 family)
VDVHGYQVVVRTDEWKDRRKGVYIQPDSLVPDRPEYAFLRTCPMCKGEGGPVECLPCGGQGTLPLRFTDRRITVRKFRKEWSQGLLMPLPREHEKAELGTDLSLELDIAHYVPPEPKTRPEDCVPGPKVPKYDVENWYRYRGNFKPGEMVVVTEKVHGANFKCVYEKETDTMFVGSRSFWRSEHEEVEIVSFWNTLKKLIGMKPTTLVLPTSNWWWNVFRMYPEVEVFCRANPGVVVYGEVYGWGVQELTYGHDQEDPYSLVIFDMYDRGWVPVAKMMGLCGEYGLKFAPVLYSGPYDDKIVSDLADGNTTLMYQRDQTPHIREGVVVRSLERTEDDRGHKMQLKIVSNTYLEKAKQ